MSGSLTLALMGQASDLTSHSAPVRVRVGASHSAPRALAIGHRAACVRVRVMVRRSLRV